MATPYDTVHRSGDRRRDHRRIAELAVEAEVEAVIVGLPLSLDGSDGPAAKKARREAGEIGRATGLPAELWDERLTPVTADRELMAMGLKADARRPLVDMVPAPVLPPARPHPRRPTTTDHPLQAPHH